ncbi:MAG: D-lyxose/D-mannose family sugar isomerase [Anaerolineae bacterium]|nr:D-lyxose/D-mannose family sugar isomerase [Thermoflexales bacterium]MDW8396440.1 D-lyxose/D-mannose family sugar isomerase [Anaerolineae bacterium]
MKRSEINAIMRDADAFLKAMHFYLPAWAYWSLDDWRKHREDAQEVINRRLGWDITDFGQGRFDELGLFLFTLRNGTLEALRAGRGMCYCEKVLISVPGQMIPLHYHWTKTEDIINRGGGELLVQVYNKTPDGDALDTSDVHLLCDGVRRTVPAGGIIRLRPGESVTLEPYCWHRFWAEGERVLTGEVSLVNDDQNDNCFLEPVGRFPTIEEDEPPLYLLVGDYHLIG